MNSNSNSDGWSMCEEVMCCRALLSCAYKVLPVSTLRALLPSVTDSQRQSCLFVYVHAWHLKHEQPATIIDVDGGKGVLLQPCRRLHPGATQSRTGAWFVSNQDPRAWRFSAASHGIAAAHRVVFLADCVSVCAQICCAFLPHCLSVAHTLNTYMHTPAARFRPCSACAAARNWCVVEMKWERGGAVVVLLPG